ncbi:sulfatase family protein [Pseudocolwellia sp. HL-MZ7]|uniref:sulfatase family protein n=1 Tax=Pseudocolwellia sp. HL-MZ7 TaxID=3400627 RepID=UPI003CF8BB53
MTMLTKPTFTLTKLVKTNPIHHLLSLSLLMSFSAVLLAGCSQEGTEAQSNANSVIAKPNVIVFYVDDLGYGDLGVYGAKGVKTPNVDALAKNGIRFTDAHSYSATGTPSHYSLLTGEYGFRENVTLLKEDSELIIPRTKPTLATLFKKAGYNTAVIGKWLLGLGDAKSDVNWNEKVLLGPAEVGFDYSFIIPGAVEKVPTIYLEDQYVVNVKAEDPISISLENKIGDRPTGAENPELLLQQADELHGGSIINGISRIGWMKGGADAEWKDDNFSQIFTNMADFYIEDNQETPFFLFFSFHDIHVPRMPNEMFKGKSSMGPRGDSIAQMDWITGQVVNKLKAKGLLDNTLIVFTSDNGPVLMDGYEDGAVKQLGNHKPAGDFRGGKYSAFEAGTRVPTIIHYPDKVKPGVSDALMSQVDLYASFADMLGIELGHHEAIDSQNQLKAWFNSKSTGRTELLQESQTFSLRTQEWKYIAPSKKQVDWIKEEKNIESGVSPLPQLYNMLKDPAEQNDLAESETTEVKRYQERIATIKARNQR